MHACVISHFRHVRLFATLWSIACQAPLSMGFSRQEQWSGSLCPPLGDLPDPRIRPCLLVSHADCLPAEPLRKPVKGKTQGQQRTHTGEHNLFILQRIKVHSSGAGCYIVMRDFIKFCVPVFTLFLFSIRAPLLQAFCDVAAETQQSIFHLCKLVCCYTLTFGKCQDKRLVGLKRKYRPVSCSLFPVPTVFTEAVSVHRGSGCIFR